LECPVYAEMQTPSFLLHPQWLRNYGNHPAVQTASYTLFCIDILTAIEAYVASSCKLVASHISLWEVGTKDLCKQYLQVSHWLSI